MDNLSAHTGADIRRWAKKNKVELCFTPTYASWANPIEAHFGPLRQFTLANSNHRGHPAQTQALQAYLRWHNANARHPDVPATPTCPPPIERNVPVSAVRRASAGVDAPSQPQLDNRRTHAVTALVRRGKACGGGVAHLLKNDRGAEAGDFTALAEPVGQEGVQVVEILYRDVKEEVVASGEHEHVEDFRQAAGEALEGVDDGAAEGTYLN